MIGDSLRFKTAVALVLLGLLTLLAGIGQKTIWAPSETFTASVSGEQAAAPLTVIDQKLRTLHGGTVKINVKGDGEFLLAVGRPGDVDAWVGGTSHNTVNGVSEDQKSLQVEHTEGEATSPSPAGSDLWVSSENANGQLDYTWTAPADGEWTLLLAKDGTAAAPTEVSMTFPNDTATPWAIPLIVIGSLVLLAGLALLVLGLFRGKGGKDKGAKGGKDLGGSKQEPFVANAPAAATDAGKPGTTDANRPGTLLGMVAAVTAAVVVGSAAPALAATPAPTDTAPPAAEEPAAAPVLLEAQLRRILEQVASAVDAGDAAKDASKLEPRVAATELEVRSQNYKISASVGSYAARTPVRSTKLLTSSVTELPEWPRTVLAVTQGDGNAVPQLLTLVQESPRENYKLTKTTLLQPGVTLPTLDRDGAQTLAPADKTGLLYSGEEALAGLADRLTTAESSFKDKLLDGAASPYIADTLSYQNEVVASGTNGTFAFTHKVDPGSTSVFRTDDGGALVLGRLTFGFDGTPKAAGDKLTIGEDAGALAGGTETTTGFALNFAESVAVYVPPAGSTDPMQLIAANRGLVGATFK
ncbi:hypothetical protein V1638_03210 [Pseudarthrobacter sp. J64]|uniref:hypothetical protein n=1 Tax=Pseudarthrobacter sp. J64 TaxID=3116485 RepID=UPI002E821532|nr:hypothetical protein [Pseudarthrobacter sp. J64]MEE2568408.1 hypothetical protein [Pseudarthrobacter sp. J64]